MNSSTCNKTKICSNAQSNLGLNLESLPWAGTIRAAFSAFYISQSTFDGTNLKVHSHSLPFLLFKLHWHRRFLVFIIRKMSGFGSELLLLLDERSKGHQIFAEARGNSGCY